MLRRCFFRLTACLLTLLIITAMAVPFRFPAMAGGFPEKGRMLTVTGMSIKISNTGAAYRPDRNLYLVGPEGWVEWYLTFNEKLHPSSAEYIFYKDASKGRENKATGTVIDEHTVRFRFEPDEIYIHPSGYLDLPRVFGVQWIYYVDSVENGNEIVKRSGELNLNDLKSVPRVYFRNEWPRCTLNPDPMDLMVDGHLPKGMMLDQFAVDIYDDILAPQDFEYQYTVTPGNVVTKWQSCSERNLIKIPPEAMNGSIGVFLELRDVVGNYYPYSFYFPREGELGTCRISVERVNILSGHDTTYMYINVPEESLSVDDPMRLFTFQEARRTFKNNQFQYLRPQIEKPTLAIFIYNRHEIKFVKSDGSYFEGYTATVKDIDMENTGFQWSTNPYGPDPNEPIIPFKRMGQDYYGNPQEETSYYKGVEYSSFYGKYYEGYWCVINPNWYNLTKEGEYYLHLQVADNVTGGRDWYRIIYNFDEFTPGDVYLNFEQHPVKFIVDNTPPKISFNEDNTVTNKNSKAHITVEDNFGVLAAQYLLCTDPDCNSDWHQDEEGNYEEGHNIVTGPLGPYPDKMELPDPKKVEAEVETSGLVLPEGYTSFKVHVRAVESKYFDYAGSWRGDNPFTYVAPEIAAYKTKTYYKANTNAGIKLKLSCIENYEKVEITDDSGIFLGYEKIFGPTRDFKFRLYGYSDYSNGIMTSYGDIYYKLDHKNGDNYSHDWKLYDGKEAVYSGHTGEYQFTAKIVNPATGSTMDEISYTLKMDNSAPVVNVTIPEDVLNGKPIKYCNVPVEIIDDGRIAKAGYYWSDLFPDIEDDKWNVFLERDNESSTLFDESRIVAEDLYTPINVPNKTYALHIFAEDEAGNRTTWSSSDTYSPYHPTERNWFNLIGTPPEINFSPGDKTNSNWFKPGKPINYNVKVIVQNPAQKETVGELKYTLSKHISREAALDEKPLEVWTVASNVTATGYYFEFNVTLNGAGIWFLHVYHKDLAGNEVYDCGGPYALQYSDNLFPERDFPDDEISVELSYEGKTNEDVRAYVTLKGNYEVAGAPGYSGRMRYFSENGTQSFEIRDRDTGVISWPSATVGNIDKTPVEDVFSIGYGTKNEGGDHQYAYVDSSYPINLDRYKLLNGNFKENDFKVRFQGMNGHYPFYIIDEEYGNKGAVTAYVNWLKEKRNLDINVSLNTYEPVKEVTATLTADRPFCINGEGEYKNTHTITYDKNGEYPIEYETDKGVTGKKTLFIGNIEKVGFDGLTPQIVYSTQNPTSTSVTASLYVGKEIMPKEGITYKDGWVYYTFENNGTFVFDVQDKYGKNLMDYVSLENITASVQWIDKTPPDCTLSYSNTKTTKDPVTVTISCPPGVEVINNRRENEYTFYKNGSFAFLVEDQWGSTFEVTAIVQNMDIEKPVITLAGQLSYPVYKGLPFEFSEPGYIAFDNFDGDITEKVQVTSNINVYRGGYYEIVYTVTDSVGNEARAVRGVMVYNNKGIDLYVNNVRVVGEAHLSKGLLEFKLAGIESPVYTMKYLPGKCKAADFKEGGTIIEGNSITINEKGWYTFYIRDEEMHMYVGHVYLQ